MRLLYDKIRESADVFSYQINSGGELGIKEQGVVKIIFKEGKFDSAALPFPLSPRFTRNGWRILGAIEEEIRKIEADLAGR